MTRMENTTTETIVIKPTAVALSLEQKKSMYVESLTSRQLRALAIAQDHLRHSFVMEKTTGFKQFCARLEKEA